MCESHCRVQPASAFSLRCPGAWSSSFYTGPSRAVTFSLHILQVQMAQGEKSNGLHYRASRRQTLTLSLSSSASEVSAGAEGLTRLCLCQKWGSPGAQHPVSDALTVSVQRPGMVPLLLMWLLSACAICTISNISYVVVHTYHPSSQQEEARTWQVQSQPGQHSEAPWKRERKRKERKKRREEGRDASRHSSKTLVSDC